MKDAVKDLKDKYRLGKTFVNHTPDKGLVSRIYKELSKLNLLKHPSRKLAKYIHVSSIRQTKGK